MTNHTPEPWFPSSYSTSYATSASDCEIFGCSGSLSSPQQHKANFNRILACVNACAGIKDPSVIKETIAFVEKAAYMDRQQIIDSASVILKKLDG